MAFFTDLELASLRIENMILHVVSDQAFAPQPPRTVQHHDFFIERIKDTDASPVFEFEMESLTKRQLEQIASGAESFESGSQSLAREFARFHGPTSKPGAFFVFELTTDDPRTRFYSLIKYDYQQVIEQSDDAGGDLLRLILQAFVAQRRAVQKSAIVRVVDGIAESGLAARDRMTPGLEIADYFANYLHVKRSRSDEELNKKLIELVRATLSDIRQHLPGQDVARAFRRVKSALRDRQIIDGEAVFEAFLAAADSPADESVRADIDSRLQRKLKSAKLDGLSFPPDLNVLRKPPLRKIVTTEGVRLFYPDDADQTIVTRQRGETGGEVITIRTQHITEDEIVRDDNRTVR